MSTERLVRKAQDGDKEAFLSLMKENELAMYRAAKAVLHREADVEDAVQETVLRAFIKSVTCGSPGTSRPGSPGYS